MGILTDIEKITILIADDHSLVREGIRKILELEPDLQVVGEAATGQEAIEMTRRYQPQVIIMDINMPGLNGIEATKVIRQEWPQIAILALTIHDDEEYIIELLRSGVSGYVLKDISAEELVQAVYQVARGARVIHPGVAQKVIGCIQKQKPFTPAPVSIPLTAREREILIHVSLGKSNREIARELFISEKTVKNHLTHIFHKIGVSDRTQAALYALKHGLNDAKLE
ncbi:DNA-binding response regulator [Moorella thermoacetica]|uniref:Stage 0 sporulation protein A homolog n=1 Tax=Moorella thermoacetica Y72 TaxID=1325331 RepID=A0A0S6UFI6_NEOTH|nr:response regulator containing a CheY-like receiver domain and an HTH DNA-binding domain [Moorella thermoacetica Y72]GLI16222.1 DNA-binding response regulator [Moorella thermoacetica]